MDVFKRTLGHLCHLIAPDPLELLDVDLLGLLGLICLSFGNATFSGRRGWLRCLYCSAVRVYYCLLDSNHITQRESLHSRARTNDHQSDQDLQGRETISPAFAFAASLCATTVLLSAAIIARHLGSLSFSYSEMNASTACIPGGSNFPLSGKKGSVNI
jgi:hypothetical protein